MMVPDENWSSLKLTWNIDENNLSAVENEFFPKILLSANILRLWLKK